ncbi:hypothetical protein Z957_05110 [Clostridium sp. K25]|uniref:hypothetical protein n=1 Tax=Clostridium sp. K25 TaxID=1443109 RepID=UPI0004D8AAD8|nr:hypothetical protein [Clostridium sp. K25]KEI09286.1 hypothetical protein Z957_05110 [Clostridium sp. K25]
MIKASFKYVIEGGQFDSFYALFTKEQLFESYREEALRNHESGINEYKESLNNNYKFIESTVKNISGEAPRIIKYFSIPRYAYGDMEICALAKIVKNGTTFMFTNNKSFADFISDTSGYRFNVRTL